jgi:hypothetical protein
MTKQQVADHVFARYPKQDEVFITSDNQAFFTPEQAEAHAPRLKDRKITDIKRKSKEEEADTDIADLGDGTDQNPFEKISGEGLVERSKEDYDAPGGTTGQEKETSKAATYDKDPVKDDGPEFSMRNNKDELLDAAKGLEADEDMTKKQILHVLYPDDEQYQEEK